MTAALTETIDTTGRLDYLSDTMEEVPSAKGLPEPNLAEDNIGWYGTPSIEFREESYENLLEVGPLVRVHQLQTPRRRFRILQQWECVVNEVNDDSVWADIADLTDRNRSDEVVELPMDEFPMADRDLLVPGGVFYWAIGYEQTKGGQVRRVSEIRFRRTPKWSEQSAKQLNEKAQTMLEKFLGDIQSDASSS